MRTQLRASGKAWSSAVPIKERKKEHTKDKKLPQPAWWATHTHTYTASRGDKSFAMRSADLLFLDGVSLSIRGRRGRRTNFRRDARRHSLWGAPPIHVGGTCSLAQYDARMNYYSLAPLPHPPPRPMPPPSSSHLCGWTPSVVINGTRKRLGKPPFSHLHPPTSASSLLCPVHFFFLEAKLEPIG